MEQYVHTLIAADSSFAPKSEQIADFLDRLVTSCNFQIIADQPYQPGVRLVKPSGRYRSFTDPLTGETKSFPVSERIRIERISDIPLVIEGPRHFSVLMSGEWNREHLPLSLLTTDGVPFDGNYLCEVSCHLRPDVVSTSCLGMNSGSDLNVPTFGEPCGADCKIGVFSHPWTEELIEVPDGGCARFWIEFEFGKFLLPQMDDTLEVLNPSIVMKAEECFQRRFVQGWRFN